MPSMPIGRSSPRQLRLVACALLAVVAVAGCGAAGPAELPLGTEAVVEHAAVSPGTGPTTTLAFTVLAVRTGTVAELEDGGFDVDEEDREKVPTYVDVRFANRGTTAIDRNLRVSMEETDGDLISPVVIFNFGDIVYEPCPDRTEGELAPQQEFETCVLFLIEAGDPAARVSFLPHVPGQETDWVYWALK